jgi:NFU1 iron-sulfur cluster scaffold homolog, mitochondrial
VKSHLAIRFSKLNKRSCATSLSNEFLPLRIIVLRMFIQTESTPNVNALKFKPGVPVVAENKMYEFRDLSSVKGSLLARQLFSVKGVKSLFFAPTFITVTKHDSDNWAVIKPEVYALMMDFFSKETLAVNEADFSQTASTDVHPADSEIVSMIKELLNTRIRPAVQEDGGDIDFVSFSDGVVKLNLKGSCRGCSSSEITLKNGIENMMRHYIPEVLKVEQVLDPVDEASAKAFQEFEASNSRK